MHGNTRIKALNTTVRKEAFSHVRSHYRHRGLSVEDAILRVTDGARPGTIGAILRDYIDGLDDAAYRRFCAEVKRGQHV